MKYHLAQLTSARVPFLAFSYSLTDFIPSPTLNFQTQLARMREWVLTHHPQTISYSLCDSTAGLVRHDPRPHAQQSQALAALPITTVILNKTIMSWLPGPEAALRWLRVSSSESRKLGEVVAMCHWAWAMIMGMRAGTCFVGRRMEETRLGKEKASERKQDCQWWGHGFRSWY